MWHTACEMWCRWLLQASLCGRSPSPLQLQLQHFRLSPALFATICLMPNMCCAVPPPAAPFIMLPLCIVLLIPSIHGVTTRRDFAVLLVHCGDLGAARAELRAYLQAVSPTAATATMAASAAAATAQAAAGVRPRPPSAAGDAAGAVDPFDLVLCRRLMALLEGMGDSVKEGGAVLSTQAVLQARPPWEARQPDPDSFKPLTW